MAQPDRPEAGSPPPPVPPRGAPAVWPLWGAVLLLAGGLGYLALREPPDMRPQLEAQAANAIGALDRRIAALESRPAATGASGASPQAVEALAARIAALEGRPAAPSPDLGPLTERLAAAERRVAELAARAAAAPAPGASPQAIEALTARVAALEGRPAAGAPELGPLAARIGAAEQRLAELAAAEQRIGELAARAATPPPAATPESVAALAARVAALEGRPAPTDLGPRLASVEARLSVVHAATALSQLLAAGQPLAPGLAMLPPNAEPPAALRAFANAPSPTEAQLRREFPEFMRAAKYGSTAPSGDPGTVLRGFLSGMVTVRRGEEVVIGSSDTAILAAAEARLDAGDLAGAVAALAPLTPGAAAAMAPWKARAQALLDARAALRTLTS